jgi:phage tail sheath protein FI
MSFQISPGINVSEIDLTTIVPVVSTTDGAIGGVFRWGPIEQRVLVDSENSLLSNFGKPTNFNAETWLTAASFTNYGIRLHVSRAANTIGTSPRVTVANIVAGNATVNVDSTANLSVGMYVVTSPSTSLKVGAQIASIVDGTSFTLSTGSDALDTISSGVIQFVTNTAFSAVANSGVVTDLAAQIVKNSEHFINKPISEYDSDVNFVARYPGELGNSLRISVCGNSAGYQSNISLASNTYKFLGTATDGINTTNINRFTTLVAPNGSKVVTVTVRETSSNSLIESANATALATATTLQSLINTTDTIVLGKDTFKVAASLPVTINLTPSSNNTNATATFTFTLDSKITKDALGVTLQSNSAAAANNTIQRGWEFKGSFDVAPTKSSYQTNFGNTSVNSDEMHIVVVDDAGKFTGVPGTILEAYRAVSRATDAKTVDGGKNYYKDVINDNSKYIYAINNMGGAPTATATLLTSSTLDVYQKTFVLGRDGADESNLSPVDLYEAYAQFASPSDVDVSLIMTGKLPTNSSAQLANYLINMAETRKDCVVFISPSKEDVVGKTGSAAADAIVATRNLIDPSSYAFMDSGYKYMYDRYNDMYRWVPLNGDTAGICARTDTTNDSWWSPAGPSRGQIRNLIRLAYNPSVAERGTLYTNGVNPVVTFPGQGTLLYGDKTLLGVASAFDRINVRRLFILLEKAISSASKSTLFEFNDAFTRSQFKNLVNPYLRDIQGRRGITDFLVVCDETNNTPEVIDRNEFVGDIYIKPARSINYIQLNFVAVRTGVAFSEVVGQF